MGQSIHIISEPSNSVDCLHNFYFMFHGEFQNWFEGETVKCFYYLFINSFKMNTGLVQLLI